MISSHETTSEEVRAPLRVKGTRASDHLDLVRGMAALVVVIYHVRYRFFLDYRDIVNPDILTRLFYSATAFGHDAVMVFFVLSGFFISGSVLGDRASGRWRAGRYLLHRLVRLYVVLLPAVALTLALDTIGRHYYGAHVVYTGAEQNWHHDYFNVADRLSAATVGGNLAFLQKILVPPLGSNDALWSLSFEFWYYMLFPVLWLALSQNQPKIARIALFVAGVAGLYFVGWTITLYFGIWLLGTLLVVLPRPRWRSGYGIGTVISFLFFVAITVAGHLHSVQALVGGSLLATDYATGVSFAIFLYFVTANRSPSKNDVYQRVVRAMAGCSYTLYAVHLPILVLLRAVSTSDRPWSPTLTTIGRGVAIGAGVVLIAFTLAQFTEARTDQVRHRVERLLGRRRTGATDSA